MFVGPEFRNKIIEQLLFYDSHPISARAGPGCSIRNLIIQNSILIPFHLLQYFLSFERIADYAMPCQKLSSGTYETFKQNRINKNSLINILFSVFTLAWYVLSSRTCHPSPDFFQLSDLLHKDSNQSAGSRSIWSFASISMSVYESNATYLHLCMYLM